MQAFALKEGAAGDARHDLMMWLGKGPEKLQKVIHNAVSVEWSALNLVWDNRIRYLSESGLFNHFKRLRLDRNIGGDRISKMSYNVNRIVSNAAAIHRKGLLIWQNLYKTK